jgi:hypothetical protein
MQSHLVSFLLDPSHYIRERSLPPSPCSLFLLWLAIVICAEEIPNTILLRRGCSKFSLGSSLKRGSDISRPVQAYIKEKKQYAKSGLSPCDLRGHSCAGSGLNNQNHHLNRNWSSQGGSSGLSIVLLPVGATCP